MAGGSKSVAAVSAAVTLLLFAPAAYAQMKKGSHATPSTETRPRVDEKAYKTALDRIPTPKKPFDPRGQVHDIDPPAKSPAKSN